MQAASPSDTKPSTAIRYREVAFVAYPSTNIARSRLFYEGVLGLRPNAEVKPDAKWVEYNVGPGCIALGQSDNWPPSKDGPSAALEVEDFDGAVATLRQHKIEFLIGPLDLPSCQMVAFRDPDGNRISLHRRKAK
jgi:catechol 2,3-dioxygenase-like lactoylglutathione lyase family enzyme